MVKEVSLASKNLATKTGDLKEVGDALKPSAVTSFTAGILQTDRLEKEAEKISFNYQEFSLDNRLKSTELQILHANISQTDGLELCFQQDSDDADRTEPELDQERNQQELFFEKAINRFLVACGKNVSFVHQKFSKEDFVKGNAPFTTRDLAKLPPCMQANVDKYYAEFTLYPVGYKFLASTANLRARVSSLLDAYLNLNPREQLEVNKLKIKIFTIIDRNFNLDLIATDDPERITKIKLIYKLFNEYIHKIVVPLLTQNIKLESAHSLSESELNLAQQIKLYETENKLLTKNGRPAIFCISGDLSTITIEIPHTLNDSGEPETAVSYKRDTEQPTPNSVTAYVAHRDVTTGRLTIKQELTRSANFDPVAEKDCKKRFLGLLKNLEHRANTLREISGFNGTTQPLAIYQSSLHSMLQPVISGFDSMQGLQQNLNVYHAMNMVNAREIKPASQFELSNFPTNFGRYFTGEQEDWINMRFWNKTLYDFSNRMPDFICDATLNADEHAKKIVLVLNQMVSSFELINPRDPLFLARQRVNESWEQIERTYSEIDRRLQSGDITSDDLPTIFAAVERKLKEHHQYELFLFNLYERRYHKNKQNLENLLNSRPKTEDPILRKFYDEAQLFSTTQSLYFEKSVQKVNYQVDVPIVSSFFGKMPISWTFKEQRRYLDKDNNGLLQALMIIWKRKQGYQVGVNCNDGEDRTGFVVVIIAACEEFHKRHARYPNVRNKKEIKELNQIIAVLQPINAGIQNTSYNIPGATGQQVSDHDFNMDQSAIEGSENAKIAKSVLKDVHAQRSHSGALGNAVRVIFTSAVKNIKLLFRYSEPDANTLLTDLAHSPTKKETGMSSAGRAFKTIGLMAGAAAITTVTALASPDLGQQSRVETSTAPITAPAQKDSDINLTSTLATKEGSTGRREKNFSGKDDPVSDLLSSMHKSPRKGKTNENSSDDLFATTDDSDQVRIQEGDVFADTKQGRGNSRSNSYSGQGFFERTDEEFSSPTPHNATTRSLKRRITI